MIKNVETRIYFFIIYQEREETAAVDSLMVVIVLLPWCLEVVSAMLRDVIKASC